VLLGVKNVFFRFLIILIKYNKFCFLKVGCKKVTCKKKFFNIGWGVCGGGGGVFPSWLRFGTQARSNSDGEARNVVFAN
jgi:hypothetical protein